MIRNSRIKSFSAPGYDLTPAEIVALQIGHESKNRSTEQVRSRHEHQRFLRSMCGHGAVGPDSPRTRSQSKVLNGVATALAKLVTLTAAIDRCLVTPAKAQVAAGTDPSVDWSELMGAVPLLWRQVLSEREQKLLADRGPCQPLTANGPASAVLAHLEELWQFAGQVIQLLMSRQKPLGPMCQMFLKERLTFVQRAGARVGEWRTVLDGSDGRN